MDEQKSITMRFPVTLANKAQKRALDLGLNLSGYIKSLIHEDLNNQGTRALVAELRAQVDELYGAVKLAMPDVYESAKSELQNVNSTDQETP